MDRGSTGKSTPPEELSQPASKDEAKTAAEPVQDESTDTDATPNAASAALVIDTKPLESLTLRPKEDNKADSDELMLDFKTFILIPEVQQVLDEGSVKASMLQDLFDIVDKDADGFVNDIEREDLLELISLSYGAKSKPSTPLNRELDPLLPPVPTLVLSAPAPAPAQPEPVPPAESEASAQKETPAKGEALESETNKGTQKEPEKDSKKEGKKTQEKDAEEGAEKNAEKESKGETAGTEKEATSEPAEENGGGVSPLSSEASTSTKSGKRKPKIIKFISPSLVVPGASQGEEAKSAETTEDQSPSTPVTPTSAAAREAAKDLPPQKKGFMVTRRERESLGSRDSSEQGQSRFFCLDNGKLSFMDSTSRKPPFSMTHREIALKGVDVQVKGTAIELTPLASVSGSGDEEEKEIVILELKTEKECAVWMDAIREHMEFCAESE